MGKPAAHRLIGVAYGTICQSLAVLLSVMILATPISGYSSGAPNSVCSSMTPGHGSQSSSASPYSISLGGTIKYKAGDTISVTISGGAFVGMMMQMRQVGTTTKYGTWSNLPANTRTQTCSNSDDTVTHSSSASKQDTVFTWTAPSDVTADLQVVATVAQQKNVWWKSLTSSTLTYDVTTTTSAVTAAQNANTATTNTTVSTDASTTITSTSSSNTAQQTTIGQYGSDTSSSFNITPEILLITFLAAFATKYIL